MVINFERKNPVAEGDNYDYSGSPKDA